MIKNIRELEEYLNISNDPPEGSRECFNELIDKLEKQKEEIEALKRHNEELAKFILNSGIEIIKSNKKRYDNRQR